jgi:hypothetical protein
MSLNIIPFTVCGLRMEIIRILCKKKYSFFARHMVAFLVSPYACVSGEILDKNQ